MLVGENPPQTKKRKVIKFLVLGDDLSNSRTPLSQPSPKSINTTIKNQRSTINMAFISSSSASKYPVRCTVALPSAKMVGRCQASLFSGDMLILRGLDDTRAKRRIYAWPVCRESRPVTLGNVYIKIHQNLCGSSPKHPRAVNKSIPPNLPIPPSLTLHGQFGFLGIQKEV